ncbi:hypothetical protein SLEP1_g33291 [Rubroshorea leprosula]|uniref:non-specific serine/threonine protein kinase n=2 Tax=Rubroshorea leprosula TaxID=152421 RepID=A0AAV5KG52_9ROSI|nr:hypothetical protein SLEP1_g33291 [Rubroshorea leprosula]
MGVRFFSIFILLAITPSLYAQEDDAQFTECTPPFTCGGFDNLSYPFWSDDRPQYCGEEGFKLRCNETDRHPVIEVNGEEFQVLRISQSAQLQMTISRIDSGNGSCPTSWDYSLFHPAETVVNMTLVGSCSKLPRLRGSNNASQRIQCTSGGKPTFYLFLGENETNPTDCGNIVEVPVQKKGLDEFNSGTVGLSELLRTEFDVEYLANGDYCSKCFMSGGSCGSNSTSSSQRFVCFCPDEPYDFKCGNSGREASFAAENRKLIIVVTTMGTGVLLTCILMNFLKKKKSPIIPMGVFKKVTETDRDIEDFIKNHESLAPKRYSFSDVKKMTNSFKEKLGQGGYGDVYKGTLPDGHLVAVKVLNASKGNGQEFINEVASISRTSHVNVVTLLGFCLQGQKRALIYEFMPNGSLEKFIFKKSTLKANQHLGWEKLYQIAIGIARGLEYLHRGCNTRILHLDIKPHNILLDEDFCPKISDFGLSKLCTRKDSIVSILEARGTIGYIAPEVFSRNFGAVSHKSDIYSYGMMVLEMVGGRKSSEMGLIDSSEIYFPHQFYKDLELANELESQGLRTTEESECEKKMILVGLWCIQTNPSDRPSTNKVIEMLEGSIEALPIPPKPFLSSPPVSPLSSATASMLV